MKPEADGIVIPLLDAKFAPQQHSDSDSTSFFRTCFNALNALIAWCGNIVNTLCSGLRRVVKLDTFIPYYTGLLIKRSMDIDPNITTYPDIGYQAFGPTGRTLVSLAINTELYIVAAGLLILEGDNIHNLFPDLEYQIGGVAIGGRQGFVFIFGLIVLPTTWLNNMTILSYISATGVIASFILIASICWATVFDDIAFHHKGTLFNYKGIPTAINLYVLCYGALSVFPTLYTSMGNKKNFSKVLLVCFTISTLSYALVAILGYLMFGSKVESQITLNLPAHKIYSKVAIYTTLVTPLAKYALMLTPTVDALEKRLLSRPSRGLSILIRTILAPSTIVVALSVPFFGYLMSLIGAFLSVAASIILPCLCYCKISGIYRRFGVEFIFICAIVFVGGVVLVVGTYTVLSEIFYHL